MKTILCRQCGHSVFLGSEYCPSCHARNSGTPVLIFLKGASLVLAFSAVILVIFVCLRSL